MHHFEYPECMISDALFILNIKALNRLQTLSSVGVLSSAFQPFIGWLRRFRTLSFDFGHQARFRMLSSLSRRSRLILKPSSDFTRLRPFSDAILHFLDALVQFHTLLSSFRRHHPISDAFIRFRISSVYNGSGVSMRI